ncbi:MAG: hypothetical protein P8Z77_03305 [Candidatus Thiodiazotropha sp.]
MSEEQHPKEETQEKPKKAPRSPLAGMLLAIWYIILGLFGLGVLAIVAFFIICSM